MQLTLSCFHMDGAGNGGNNDKSVLTESVLPILPPFQSISFSLPASPPLGHPAPNKWLQERSSIRLLPVVIAVGCIFELRHMSV